MGIFIRFPDGRPKALTFSYDDGVVADRRLVKIVTDHGLKGTFNINSGRFAEGGWRITADEVRELYIPNGHEVACHALTHPFLDRENRQVALFEVTEDRRNLEALTGGMVRGMAYPYGTYNDETVEALRMAGIAYCRTVAATRNFNIPTDWLRMPATCHHKDPQFPELAKRFVTQSPDEVSGNRDAWLFYVWGHSYEFDNDDNWQVIEDFADTVSGKEDVWYATNIEIYDYVTAYRRLQFGITGNMVYNPSALDVWIDKDRTLYHIPAGATVKF